MAAQPLAPKPRKRLTLKSARIRKDLTQSELAALLDVSQQTVAKWENGRTTPAQFSTLRTLEALLECAAAELFPDVFA